MLAAERGAARNTLAAYQADLQDFAAFAAAKGVALHEWEVPFDWPDDWPEAARGAFDAFHAARQAMQRRMDQSIADHAEQETLYDKPVGGEVVIDDATKAALDAYYQQYGVR